jgi:hypothetical protein
MQNVLEQNRRQIKKTPALICLLFMMGMGCGVPTPAGAGSSGSPSLSEVVLFGIRSVSDLDFDKCPSERRQCLQRYLQAVAPDSSLLLQTQVVRPEEAVQIRRRRLQEQIVLLIGHSAEAEAKTFSAAVPISLEWEGMSEGPLDEADRARQWLERYPATPLRPFLHLFMAHRLRAGFEAARREQAKGLWPILAERYKKEIAIARSSPNELIACLAEDLEAQPHVYLAGFGHP